MVGADTPGRNRRHWRRLPNASLALNDMVDAVAGSARSCSRSQPRMSPSGLCLWL